MFQRGRGEQPIKYKAEVLKINDKAYLYKSQVGMAIIDRDTDKRISDVYKAAWKCWESAYYFLVNNSGIIEERS